MITIDWKYRVWISHFFGDEVVLLSRVEKIVSAVKKEIKMSNIIFPQHTYVQYVNFKLL